jgi:tRNA nucleotidyltransferase/poly(A) polymerase
LAEISPHFSIVAAVKIMKLPIDTEIFPEKTGVYVVGGSIRDLILKRKPLDYDLAVQHDAALFARRLAANTSGHIVEFGKHGYTMRRVVTKDHFFDIMPISGENITSDLLSRDFTINAMAVDVSNGNLIDPLDAQKDLAAKKVRLVSREVFRQDPLRLVRAYRMAAALDFTIDKDTKAAIETDADLIQKTAGERIREELFKILQCANSHVYLAMMARSGLLFSVFPEFLKLKQLRLHPAAPRTVLEQTLDSYFHLEMLLDPADELGRIIRVHSDKEHAVTRSILLKWSLLFHDLGSPPAKPTIAHAKKSDYIAHAARSAVLAQEICKRLRFSRRQTDIIESIVRNHFRPFILFHAHLNNGPVDKGFIRFFLKCGDVTPDVLLHALAEFMGKNDSNPSDTQKFTEFIRSLIQKYYTVLLPRASVPSPINGKDLINEFGMKPSAQFKQILARVEEKRLTKQTFTREEAIKLVKKLLNQK